MKKPSPLKGKPRKRCEDGNHTPPLAPTPTNAIPGTEDKIVVMEDRIVGGFRPFHPRDYREDRRPT